MGLIHADNFLRLVQAVRKVWIRGFLGSGKTLLASVICEELLIRGFADGVLANIETVFPNRLDYSTPDDGTLSNRIILMDEAHEYMDSRSSLSNSKDIGAYLRKSNTYLISPSIYPVDKRQRDIAVWRDFDFFGLNLLWIYKYQIQVDYSTQKPDWFGLWRPSSYYSRYDSFSYPDSDFGQDIISRSRKTSAQHSGGKYKPKDSSTDLQMMADMSRIKALTDND